MSDVSKPLPRSVQLAQDIRTAADFANTMGAMMADVLSGAVTPQVVNAACNAGGKMLRAVEMQYRYGVAAQDGGRKNLPLTEPPPDPPALG